MDDTCARNRGGVTSTSFHEELDKWISLGSEADTQFVLNRHAWQLFRDSTTLDFRRISHSGKVAVRFRAERRTSGAG